MAHWVRFDDAGEVGNSFLAAGQTIRSPRSYDGRAVFEGELGIVIGRTAREVAEREAKSFDTFGVFGPVVASGIDAAGLSVRILEPGDVVACAAPLTGARRRI
jgi:2-keto-4-pentenoate hydratase/2-oxohepta-3-ene-1,7-dioic acid hydratase in catechol pathway